MPDPPTDAFLIDKTYYQILGVSPSASAKQIRQAYRSLSKRYHPDTADLSEAIATVRFQQLWDAYNTLSNSKHRAIYDFKLGYTHTLDPALTGVIAPPVWSNNLTPEELKFRQQCQEDSQKVMQDLRNLFIRLILLGAILGGVCSWAVVNAISDGQLLPTPQQQR